MADYWALPESPNDYIGPNEMLRDLERARDTRAREQPETFMGLTGSYLARFQVGMTLVQRSNGLEFLITGKSPTGIFIQAHGFSDHFIGTEYLNGYEIKEERKMHDEEIINNLAHIDSAFIDLLIPGKVLVHCETKTEFLILRQHRNGIFVKSNQAPEQYINFAFLNSILYEVKDPETKPTFSTPGKRIINWEE